MLEVNFWRWSFTVHIHVLYFKLHQFCLCGLLCMHVWIVTGKCYEQLMVHTYMYESRYMHVQPACKYTTILSLYEENLVFICVHVHAKTLPKFLVTCAMPAPRVGTI